MKYKLFALTLIGFTFTGCSTNLNLSTPSNTNIKKTNANSMQKSYAKPSAKKLDAYHDTMMKVALSTQKDPNYKKIAFDTPEKKAWFGDLTYRLWDRQITRNQFLEEGLENYPTHQYEFNFIANGFQQYS